MGTFHPPVAVVRPLMDVVHLPHAFAGFTLWPPEP